MTNLAAEASPEHISRAADDIRKIKPEYRQMIDLYEKIFIAQEQSMRGIRLKRPVISDGELSAKASERSPLVDVAGFAIDRESSTALFSALCGILGGTDGELSESVKMISGAVENGTVNMGDMFAAFLRGDESFFATIESEQGIGREVLGFIVYNSLRPSLRAFSDAVSVYLDNGKEWDRGYCPVCGSAPAMSLFEDEGKRSLVCGFCGHKWPSKRVYCPLCENTDHESMSYYEIEDEEEYRVDVCDRCHGYVKTIDMKKTARTVYLPFEYVTTPYLDIRFKEMGYSPGCNPLEQETGCSAEM